MANDSLNFGMGSRRPRKNRPAEGKSVEPSPVVDRWDGIPFPVGSIVTTPAGDKGRVLGVRDDGNTRVVEVIEGDALGSRGVYQPRQLGMLEHPGPRVIKPDHRPPKPIALNLPGPNDPRLLEQFPDPDDREAYLADQAKALDERFGGPEGWRAGAGPTVVVGPYSPEMFGQLQPSPVVLENGPFAGVEIKVPSKAEIYQIPAANPEPGDGRPQYVPAVYKRTARRHPDSGLVVFTFDRYELPEMEPAAAG